MNKTNFKFKVGDRVRVLDGSKISDYTAYWNNFLMPTWVGKEARITHRTIINGKPAYVLEGTGFKWDERGLEPLKNDCIVIYRKGQEVIALDKVTGKKAVAKCSPEDTFDFNIGSKLAFERLLGVEQPQYKEVNRKAKKGEYVKIVKPNCTSGFYDKGSILKVIESCVFGVFCIGAGITSKNGYYVEDREYFVLEGYKPPKEEKKEGFFNGKAVYVGYHGTDEPGYKIGKIYEFKDGFCIDDDGERRPCTGCVPYKEVPDGFIAVVE